ncbi:pyridoxamine 5'-phosphate oxidase-related FMN- binding protein [Kribbella flavida DSM 17836]|uniref:Pyridoxamine 5'-phosphate oxidase-related FMN-binding protein n=1 Tax=Kribbella flavida (strain DSM 17836 / JCM 10339 / NBRC 14399) TaxID=479435 RepID=D2Q0X8_KRIFD|nr:pyridoxamine 5'-phosphate oxidase family protein [Kribbella flavida]ADB35679.1 pyridoxamine 5'-phosphate oxidase-related FMN- binding protein [Kribbella flavida DSM 17836]
MTKAVSFAELRDDLTAILSRIRYATMTTVDPHGRPRSRVLIAVWELAGPDPLGWLATFRTPVKARHLAGNPHTSFSYWDPRQDTASIDATATWTDRADERHHVWQLYEDGSPRGVGYPPGAFWPGGPDSEQFQVLRLEPYRIQVLRGHELSRGVPARQWSRPSATA